MSGYRVMACSPVWVGDKAKGVEQTRWFPALVGNHIADILKWHGSDTHEVPEALTAYVRKREGVGADEGYDYSQHTQMDDENTYYITDEIVEAFGVIGPAEAHVEKMRRLEAAGVTQFNIYLCSGEEERQIAEYGEHVIPQFR